MYMLRKVKNFIKPKQIIKVNVNYVSKTLLLDNRIAVVVGGSSGIGKAIAKSLISSGGQVILVGRNKEKLKRAKEEMREQCLGYIVADVSDYHNCIELPTRIQQLLGEEKKVSILVNAAGFLSQKCLSLDFLNVEDSDWEKVMNTNIKGMFFLCQSFIKYFLEKGVKAHILNICSTEGLHGAIVPYGISKWGTVGLTKGLGKKFAKDGIIVNGIAPGGTATEMLGFKKNSPLNWGSASGRVSIPEEIGNLAMFMCSDMGGNMVGEVVVYDGGENLR